MFALYQSRLRSSEVLCMGDDLNDLMSLDLAALGRPFISVYSGARALTDRVMCEAPTGTQSRFGAAFPASPPAKSTRAEHRAPIASSEILDA